MCHRTVPKHLNSTSVGAWLRRMPMLKLPSNQPRTSKCHASDGQALAALASCVVCPELLGLAAIAVGTCSDVIDVNVTFTMNVRHQSQEAVVHRLDVSGFLSPRVGFVGDLDFNKRAGLLLRSRRMPTNNPVLRIHITNGNGRQLWLLVQNLMGAVGQHLRHLLGLMRVSSAAEQDVENGHGYLR